MCGFCTAGRRNPIQLMLPPSSVISWRDTGNYHVAVGRAFECICVRGRERPAEAHAPPRCPGGGEEEEEEVAAREKPERVN